MPTNLPPEYYAVEKDYKEAKDPKEKARLLEELISTIPKHKGTDKLRASLRQKLSKLKTAAQSKKKGAKQESLFHIEKEGDGRISLIGCANVGKSTLVAHLTHAKPEISDYPFSTWIPTPGMMMCKDIQLQLIDTPPINRDFVESEFFDLVRTSDLIMLMIDLQDFPFQQMEDTLNALADHHIAPVRFKEKYKDQKMAFVPTLIVVNKDDDEKSDEDYDTLCELMEIELPLQPISAKSGRNMNDLMNAVCREMHIIRIYSKAPGKDPELNRPFVLKEGDNVGVFASKVHHDFVDKLKSARIWGANVHDGQLVGRDHILSDGDIVELHI
ncbi:GTPase [Bacteroidota bacterium]